MKKLIFPLICILIALPLSAASDAQFIIRLNGTLWGFDFLDDSTVIYTLKQGELGLIDLENGSASKVSHSINFAVHGQGGLLDVAYDEQSSLIFISYSKKTAGGYTTALARGRLSDERNRFDSEEIFSAEATGKAGRHFGSRIALDKANRYIYLSVGDRGQREKAQYLSRHNGSILRLDYEGNAPQGNPFVNKGNALPEIWSYGHRNPQGLYLTKDGQLFQTEFGPKGGDEINLIEPGLNYGWPKITWGREYSGAWIAPGKGPGMEQPVAYYNPVISPSGMMVYEASYHSKWEGDMFIANLSSRHLRRVRIRNKQVIEEEELFKNIGRRIRHVNYSPSGRIYFSTDRGELFLVP